MAIKERVESVFLTDVETGKKYELDFNRDTIRFAEAKEFVLEDVTKYIMTGVSDLFYYAFRMHHRNVSRAETDALLEKMGGMSGKLLERLIALYDQARTANVIKSDDDEEDAKNAKVTVEL